ncbi:NAD(P)H-dependent oxidoreductase [Aureivirga sp. CE67]|uniref:NAD(P)H-dependent oxidoreductase n=1 Tax=Aureivirga sp. CE67 TaxID=1788983 RepID=UPI0018CA2CEF|nr:NAD(P)H-dependent oxidoreductase [Aureivirga sp. CE67]
MEFLNNIQNRYTTKKYDNTKKVSEEDIKKLKHILHLSPSSINSQPWNFIFVSDEETKNKLADASFFNAERIKDASHVVVFNTINNKSFFEKQINENLPEGAVGYYNAFLKEKPETEVVNWLSHQVYIALGVFLSACANMDIDSTPMEGIEPEKYAEILKLDEHTPLFAVAIGYRDENDANQPTITAKQRLCFDDVIKSI